MKTEPRSLVTYRGGAAQEWHRLSGNGGNGGVSSVTSARTRAPIPPPDQTVLAERRPISKRRRFRPMRNYLPLVALVALTLAPASPAAAGARVYVRIGPPVPVVETRVVAPSPRHVWIGGYHRWDGRA